MQKHNIKLLLFKASILRRHTEKDDVLAQTYSLPSLSKTLDKLLAKGHTVLLVVAYFFQAYYRGHTLNRVAHHHGLLHS